MSRRNGTTKGGALRGEAKGIATVTCAVCGGVINKRQTMGVEGVRVCKGHSWSAKQTALWDAQKRAGLALCLTPENKALVGA